MDWTRLADRFEDLRTSLLVLGVVSTLDLAEWTYRMVASAGERFLDTFDPTIDAAHGLPPCSTRSAGTPDRYPITGRPGRPVASAPLGQQAV